MSIEIKSNQIVFSSRKKYLPTLSCKLLALFICPACNQILKAFLETEKPVPWLKYEGVEEDQSRFESITVPGGQGLIDKTHKSYNPDCDLEIYWALNPRSSLQEWLEKNYEDFQFRDIQNVVEQVIERKVEGLVFVADQIKQADFLLGYDKNKWEGEWDSQKESYEQWEKEHKRNLKKKIDLLSCTRKER